MMTFRSSYELDVEIGFALLEQLEEQGQARRFQYSPEDGAFDELLLSGVYGGMVDFDSAQEFYVYSLQWPDELHDDEDEDLFDLLSSELDSLFPGWVFDTNDHKVYILNDPDLPPPAL